MVFVNLLIKKNEKLNIKWLTYCTKTSRSYYWTNGTRTLNQKNEPKKLLKTVYFLFGKHFALKNCREHHDLRHEMGSQIKFVGMGQEKKVMYQEDLSKNNNGGLKHANYKAKTGTIFSTGGSQLSKSIWTKIHPKSKLFYCRPRENESEKDWFHNQAIGVNTLASIIPNIAKEAGWDTVKLWSGHSLRASAITALYDHGFDDKSVKKFSGHRSDFAFCENQRSEKRKRQTSEILSRTSQRSPCNDSTGRYHWGRWRVRIGNEPNRWKRWILKWFNNWIRDVSNWYTRYVFIYWSCIQ